MGQNLPDSPPTAPTRYCHPHSAVSFKTTSFLGLNVVGPSILELSSAGHFFARTDTSEALNVGSERLQLRTVRGEDVLERIRIAERDLQRLGILNFRHVMEQPVEALVTWSRQEVETGTPKL